MAKQFVLTDDIDGTTDEVATVRFSLDGISYEIDLTTEHKNQLRDALAPYIANGRRADYSQRGAVKPKAPRPANQTTPVIRAWAKTNGYDVPDRGRLPKTVVEAWESAHEPHPPTAG